LGQRAAGAVDLELIGGQQVMMPSRRVLERRGGDQDARLAHEVFLLAIVFECAWAARHHFIRTSFAVFQASKPNQPSPRSGASTPPASRASSHAESGRRNATWE